MSKESPRSWTKDVDWKYVAPLPFVPIVLAVVFMPKIQHALDFGRDVVSVADVAKGHSFSSHNVVIKDALPVLEMSLQLTTSRVSPSSERVMNVDQFIPLVSAGWQPGDPISVIMKIGKGINTSNKLDSRATTPGSFEGVARNIMWEGVPSDIKTIYERDVKAKFADNVLLFTLQDDKMYDYLMAAAVPFSLFIVAIIGWMSIGPAWKEEKERRQRIARSREQSAKGGKPAPAAEDEEDDDGEDDAEDDDDADDDDDDDDSDKKKGK